MLSKQYVTVLYDSGTMFARAHATVIDIIMYNVCITYLILLYAYITFSTIESIKSMKNNNYKLKEDVHFIQIISTYKKSNEYYSFCYSNWPS